MRPSGRPKTARTAGSSCRWWTWSRRCFLFLCGWIFARNRFGGCCRLLLERVATRKRTARWGCLLQKRIATSDGPTRWLCRPSRYGRFCNGRLQWNSSSSRRRCGDNFSRPRHPRWRQVQRRRCRIRERRIPKKLANDPDHRDREHHDHPNNEFGVQPG